MCITMLSLVMSITMLSSVSAKEASIEYQGVWTDYAAKEYAAGDGTKESPYLIKDASELALLAKNVCLVGGEVKEECNVCSVKIARPLAPFTNSTLLSLSILLSPSLNMFMLFSLKCLTSCF